MGRRTTESAVTRPHAHITQKNVNRIGSRTKRALKVSQED